MAMPKGKSWTRRIMLDKELCRIAGRTKDGQDQFYLLWAARTVKAQRLEEQKTQHPDVAELERMFRLPDPRGW